MKKNVIKALIGLAFSVATYAAAFGIYFLLYGIMKSEQSNQFFALSLLSLLPLAASIFVYYKLQRRYDSVLLTIGTAVGHIAMSCTQELLHPVVFPINSIFADGFLHFMLLGACWLVFGAILVIDLIRLLIRWILGPVRESVRRRRYAKNADSREPDLLDKIEKE